MDSTRSEKLDNLTTQTTNEDNSQKSKIHWPKRLTAIPEMCYESISPLYIHNKPEFFGEKLGFAVSCSKHFSHPKGCRGCIHKLEVDACPDFDQAKMQVTHEVNPCKGACSQIIDVNEKLKVACFDQGFILPIKNFGYKKTFNCDVRGGLQHHTAPINCLASDSVGCQIASGCTDGEIALYQARDEEVSFLTRMRVSNTIITGLAFFRPTNESEPYRSNDEHETGNENLLIYSSGNGRSGFVDTRCKFGSEFDDNLFLANKPRLDLSALCFIQYLPAPIVCLGTRAGQIVTIDLRYSKQYLYQQDHPEDKCIRRMKRVLVKDKDSNLKTFLSYTNATNQLKILDFTTMKSHDGWQCKRVPGDIVQDFCQVDNRIVTCGTNTSIGCWSWTNAPDSNIF